jgi:hypothetical protein
LGGALAWMKWGFDQFADHEARRARENRGDRPTRRIGGRGQHERKRGEKSAVLDAPPGLDVILASIEENARRLKVGISGSAIIHWIAWTNSACS